MQLFCMPKEQPKKQWMFAKWIIYSFVLSLLLFLGIIFSDWMMEWLKCNVWQNDYCIRHNTLVECIQV